MVFNFEKKRPVGCVFSLGRRKAMSKQSGGGRGKRSSEATQLKKRVKPRNTQEQRARTLARMCERFFSRRCTPKNSHLREAGQRRLLPGPHRQSRPHPAATATIHPAGGAPPDPSRAGPRWPSGSRCRRVQAGHPVTPTATARAAPLVPPPGQLVSPPKISICPRSGRYGEPKESESFVTNRLSVREHHDSRKHL